MNVHKSLYGNWAKFLETMPVEDKITTGHPRFGEPVSYKEAWIILMRAWRWENPDCRFSHIMPESFLKYYKLDMNEFLEELLLEEIEHFNSTMGKLLKIVRNKELYVEDNKIIYPKLTR